MSEKKLSGVEKLAIILPFLLIAPNIGLDFTDSPGFLSGLLNLIVPLTGYMLLMSLWKRTGILTLLMIPMMCFCGFQIVLLYLYGGSIIGVDMFLNVVTTNMTEINELLGNLLIAIGIILLLYLPAIIYGIIFTVRRQFLQPGFRKRYLKVSLCSFIISLVITLAAAIFSGYEPDRDMFPINIFRNLATAFERTEQLGKYELTSAGFTYDAEYQQPDSVPEIYVMVIGETGRAANWSLGGYERNTNPRLSGIENLVYFPYTLSESNTTHKSVPMLISPLSGEDFNDIGKYKSALTLFKEAGFRTAFFSNQQRNRSYTEFFANEADTTVYLSDLNVPQYDGELVNLLKKQIEDTAARRQFIILHCYGSHFKYADRYPAGSGSFKPDDAADANKSNRDRLINAFDNTIEYADSCLAEVYNAINRPGVRGAMVFATDHGEDIFDDSRNRFLHASIVPTYYQLHVPMLVAVSDHYAEYNPQSIRQLRQNSRRQASSTKSLFNTIVDLSGINTPYLDLTKSLASPSYSEPRRIFVTDRNEAVTLPQAGITPADEEQFRSKGLKY